VVWGFVHGYFLLLRTGGEVLSAVVRAARVVGDPDEVTGGAAFVRGRLGLAGRRATGEPGHGGNPDRQLSRSADGESMGMCRFGCQQLSEMFRYMTLDDGRGPTPARWGVPLSIARGSARQSREIRPMSSKVAKARARRPGRDGPGRRQAAGMGQSRA